MAYYDLKKKPSLTTKEGEKETLYPSIVYQNTIPAEKIFKFAEQRCGLKDGVMAGALNVWAGKARCTLLKLSSKRKRLAGNHKPAIAVSYNY